MPQAICTQLLSLAQGIRGKLCWGRDGGGENSELCGRLMLLSALKRSEDM